MVPADLKDFLVAVVTASASFIGLLFVAMSLITDKSGKDAKRIATENILAESAYIALLDLFFVSLVALIPNTTIGTVNIVMSVLGLSNSARLIRAGTRDGVDRSILSLTTLVYMFQAGYGIYIISHSHIINIGWFETIVLTLFGSALGRAWVLTGVNNKR